MFGCHETPKERDEGIERDRMWEGGRMKEASLMMPFFSNTVRQGRLIVSNRSEAIK